jgi:uncharacterized protein DUF1153
MSAVSSEASITVGARPPELNAPAGPRQPIPRMPAPIELPPPDTKRWVVRRKAAVVVAVRRGQITLEEACRRYQLSEAEFHAWQSALEAHGERGLRATRLQQYRNASSTRNGELHR